MLAKVWKKALLIICIIACLFNVTNKIVKHTSLDKQLKSILDTNFGDDEIQVTTVENNEENQ